MMSLKSEYKQLMCDKILIRIDDLSETEAAVIENSFDIIDAKVKYIKELEDRIYQLEIEIRNLKSYQDNNDY